jgi:2-polyprenyl-3-methyl-5-hydroxy-6-metoxy-1,4-benzoquinol methylase
MTINCLLALAIQLRREDIEGKRILEVGSQDVNGSIRPLAESYKPCEYIGVDIVKGKNVDLVCDSGNLITAFGRESFDMVISTSLLEHVKDWRQAIHNMKGVCKTGGTILVTSCSMRFPYHGYPYDFWRFETDDLKNIFSDCKIFALQKVPSNLVLITVKKPDHFAENYFLDYELYSIVANKKVKDIAAKDFRSLYFKKIVLKSHITNFMVGATNYICSRL